MFPSGVFIQRPVATTLLTLAVMLAGLVAFLWLPVAPLPQIDFPTLSVTAKLPGASPETMAATVATPLERTLGRIAGITEMTSTSTLGATSITLQFDLDRDINGAARDVQAAINAARTLLPSGMPSNPGYRKVNPADSPVMILAMTSKTLTPSQMYDAADSVLGQKLAQVEGIGNVIIGGGAQPAVRVDINPAQLAQYGLALEDVRSAIAGSNLKRPLGVLDSAGQHWQVQTNDALKTARDYLPVIVSYRHGAPVRLAQVAGVSDSVLDIRTAGRLGREPAVMLILFKQPGANIIETVDRVRALMPQLQAWLPAAIELQVVSDRTPTIRAALREVEKTLALSVGLVVLVVALFLKSGRAVAIPAISVPVSLLGTLAGMYLCGYSLNTLSLMALTVATGFVVDDTIVVLENIMRYLEEGMAPLEAARRGVREVGFTVVSMSLSLIAVFIPVLLMGGIIGRLFREFAVTLSVAILISMLVSLATTPMLCARWLRPVPADTGEPSRRERFWLGLRKGYDTSLEWSVSHGRTMLLLLAGVVALNVFLYLVVPKGFFPQQDTGRLNGLIKADQEISFDAMKDKLDRLVAIVQRDPAVDKVVAFTGGGQRNTGNMFVTLKPAAVRQIPADAVIARLRKETARVAGVQLLLQSVQDIRMGGRSSGAQYQYTLQGDQLDTLRAASQQVFRAIQSVSVVTDVNSDQEIKGGQVYLTFDRDAMARLGVSQQQADAVLQDAFSQRQVSTIFNPLNQYHVVMGVPESQSRHESDLDNLRVINAVGQVVPLSAFARWETRKAALSVNHQGQFAASTLSFNLQPGHALSEAAEAIGAKVEALGLGTGVRGSFQGTAKVFQESLANQPWLILAAVVAVYIVLGMLYESLIHPFTILSTLPSAGVGALLALMLAGQEFNVIALIGILLLVGIVKKNAIMMIDFAISAQRDKGLTPRDAILEAARLRFRPILMTTLAAVFGAIPLALGQSDGAEIRAPLGISIVGGLLVSQLLTLYTTPVVYLYLDRFRLWLDATCRPDRAGRAGETS
ncbi:efflux RND transporter permease subunit [Laribacter hongkongensis]|uniref:efflux RND transporter permease subunit n=1 Tax=Laribacter hongkongensis TaxID=168471 RepID=UPI001EFDCCA3|nr:efflux RND transporter permease subunit [Laribacter hongkongensis]MCG9075864.1 efflux RND transporter permease subunit [Laribacter hongkongensis]